MEQRPAHFRTYLIGILAVIISMGGTALITLGQLGTAPISSPVYVASLIGGLSFGGWTFVINLAFIATQVILLRESFPKTGWLQAPLLAVGSIFLDVWMWALAPFEATSYFGGLALVAIGTVVLGFGIAIIAAANTLYLPGEGLVAAIATRFRWSFPRVKLAFDALCVTIAVILSLTFLGELSGAREGTIIAAASLGPIVGFFLPTTRRFLDYVKA